MNKSRKNDGDRFAEEWSQLRLRGRVILAAYMMIGAFGGLMGADMILGKFPHSWIAWTISLIILEPVGLACALGLFVVMFPRSRVAAWFSHALSRAKLAAIAVGFIFVCGIVGSLTFLLYDFFKSL